MGRNTSLRHQKVEWGMPHFESISVPLLDLIWMRWVWYEVVKLSPDSEYCVKVVSSVNWYCKIKVTHRIWMVNKQGSTSCISCQQQPRGILNYINDVICAMSRMSSSSVSCFLIADWASSWLGLKSDATRRFSQLSLGCAGTTWSRKPPTTGFFSSSASSRAVTIGYVCRLQP